MAVRTELMTISDRASKPAGWSGYVQGINDGVRGAYHLMVILRHEFGILVASQKIFIYSGIPASGMRVITMATKCTTFLP